MRTRQFESFVRERCRSGSLTFPEALGLFDHLLHFRDPAPSIITFNFLFTSLVRMKDVSRHYATVLSLFNQLPRPRGISPDVCTYSICIDCCARVNRLGLAFALLGRLLKDRLRAKPIVFTPLLKGLCRDNRITEAADMVFDKMPKLGCAPNLISYAALIKGYFSAEKTIFATELLHKMITQRGEF
ncbi:Pentatricopeptide repeat-containing protein [Rhynchospora pubera]|uniref:Pentatricopeptide repeat-containing protein n=1 Tax=Rhynchospora pubera TaxID=906938 RepID=A0AAV8DC95_9POAL|nr:Pentatricopeptide repeat-containing protein [Rhynchospora pubera]